MQKCEQLGPLDRFVSQLLDLLLISRCVAWCANCSPIHVTHAAAFSHYPQP